MSLDVINTNDETDFSVIPTKELKKALSRSLELTSKHLLLLGKIWVELENRGIDLSYLRSGLTRYLPMIGEGKLNPDVVIRFAGQQLLLREITLLPLKKQKGLLEGDKIPLVTQNGVGEYTTEMVDMDTIHARHYPQIFDGGAIRSESEQKRWLSKPKRIKRQGKTRHKKITVDKKRGIMQVGQVRIILEDVVAALRGNDIV